MNNPIKIGIAGLGTIGSGVINNLLRNQVELEEKFQINFEIAGVSAASKEKLSPVNPAENSSIIMDIADPLYPPKGNNTPFKISFGSSDGFPSGPRPVPCGTGCPSLAAI